MKFCKDCKFYKEKKPIFLTKNKNGYCVYPKYLNVVTGEVIVKSAEEQRKSEYTCGYDGNWFEAKGENHG